MLRLSRIRLRIRALLSKRRLDGELRGELEYHLAELKAENMLAGMTEAAADAAARRAFGPVGALEEACRDQRRTRWLEDLVQDARHALRSFAKSPSFTLAAVVTLALGIGANTAFFSVAWSVLFRPLPYPDPGRLVELQDGVERVGAVVALREMAAQAEYAGYFPNLALDLQQGGEAVRVQGAAATWNLSRVLRVPPALGRWFDESEERHGRNRVAVLSSRAWRDRFGSAPDITGRRVLMNEEPYEIIGVMPPGFVFPTPETDLWVPIRLDARDVGYLWGSLNLWPIARLHDGATLSTARSELGPAIDRIRGMFPWRMPDAYARGARLVEYLEALTGSVRPKMLALAASTFLLLLIACANVANLLLSRGVAREREFAMREALGAGRARLVRQLLAESGVLVAAGGLAGLGLAVLLLKAVPLLLPRTTPRLHEIGANAPFLLISASCLLLTIVLFGAAPAARISRTSPGSLGGPALTPCRRRSRFSLAVVGVQLSLATALLIGAGLTGRSLWVLSRADTGVRTGGVVAATVSAGPARCGSPGCRTLLEELNRAVLGFPGVRSVNWTNFAPLTRRLSTVSVAVEDHPREPAEPAYVFAQTEATPGYLRALGVPLLAGRFFTDADRSGSEPVAVISEATAKHFWPGESPIGKRTRPVFEKTWRTVVGVVADVAQYSPAGFPAWIDGLQYVPLAQARPPAARSMELTMLVESSVPEAACAALSAELPRRFAGLAVARAAPLERIRSESLADQRSTAWLLALFAGAGLLLGIAGVYGLISHRVAQRTPEIAVRMALGASAGNVARMVMKETFLVAASGSAAGIALALALVRFLRSMLFGVSARDAATYFVCTAALMAAALLAAAIPGLRAAKTDPAETLRE